MSYKIFITRNIPEVGLKMLREKNIEFDVGKWKTPPSKKDLIKALKDKPYDGVISFLTDNIDAEIFDACPSAKGFANFSVGFNNIDLEEAQKRNIAVSNTPGVAGTAVSEHTVAFMLTMTTRMDEGDRFMRSGKYKGWDAELLIGTDLKDKVIGLIGVGDIGTKVAKILHFGFGAKIIYSDIVPNPTLEKIDGATKMETAEILKIADIVSLHVPLLPTTHHLINKDSLSTMKKTAYLINTSRGPVVDENALVEALKNGVIKGAGLDVYEFEPKLAKGLLKLSNVVLTPHIASARASCRNLMAEIVAKNIISMFEKGVVINGVIK